MKISLKVPTTQSKRKSVYASTHFIDTRVFSSLRLRVFAGELFSMTENELSRIIVDSAYRIHTTLGPGLLESVYKTVLASVLQKPSRFITDCPASLYEIWNLEEENTAFAPAAIEPPSSDKYLN